MSINKNIIVRLKLLYFGVVLMALFILVQAFKIGVIDREFWMERNEKATLKLMSIDAVRGNIYSSDGSLLATSVPMYNICMDFTVKPLTDEIFNSKIDSLALCLSETFKDKSKAQYKQELTKARAAKKDFYFIKKGVSYKELTIVKGFPIFRLGQYKGGFITQQLNYRELPHRLLAKQTIGKVVDSNGVGIEGAFHDELKGINGQSLKRKLSGGIWRPISDKNEIDPVDGNDIISTLDVGIQDIAEHALLKQLNKHEAEAGCVIMMEVETGHVKAMANLRQTKDGNYDEILNDAIGYSSEPGSTFKLINLIALLEDGLVKVNDTINTFGGVVKFGSYVVKDSHEGGYGKITVARGLEVSSNTVFSQIVNNAYKADPSKYIHRLRSMGIDQKLGIALNHEAAPFINTPERTSWSRYSLPAMSMGYEVRITPLQTLAFYNAIANNGKLLRPLFVKEIRKRGLPIKKFEPVVLNPAICSQLTLNQVKPILEGVIEQGTASNLKSSQYKIAGKTGTAKIASKEGGYEHTNYQASFAGYFPADKPKYSCIVMVYNPSSNGYYGNVVAGNVFKEIADKIYAQAFDMHDDVAEETEISDVPSGFPRVKYGFASDLTTLFNYLNLQVENEGNGHWSSVKTEQDRASIKKYTVQDNMVPNVKGMGLRDALFLLENAGLKVQVNGKGTVKKQSLNPGSPFEKNQTILIELG